ncbi:hypothetical protein SPSYN_01907 [Sporotomaculum syntrophicum]|uniref:DUF35 domain-containing protein n=1 Tax=Sporotomaculum syntrophicum TaxID=182264 RepID=A0A9D2WQZ2_9FIRM|nr:Zn-ribbon domain-containing OB-fold protein [Sporotomaculum syntrophicum]KAF1085759.1 hypothetical protein SPSYN_01907 [Sporotomaculum syntrophicum]
MSFKKFGRKSFASQTKVDAFVDYLEKGEVRGTQCKSCGAKFFPPRADCDQCLSNDMDWFPIDGVGTLVTFTRQGFAPTGFEKDVPYTTGMAAFDGVQVFGRLDGSIPEEEVEIGMKVAVRTIQYDDGQLSYEFIKA